MRLPAAGNAGIHEGVPTTGRLLPAPGKGGESLIEYLRGLFSLEEQGQTMAEYAVVLGVITIAVVVTLGLLSTKISAVLNSVISAM